MKAHLWFSVEEMEPDESGYYLSFTGATMGGGEPETSYNFYDKKRQQWRTYESESMGQWANVVYWTDADPFSWYENNNFERNRTKSEAEKIAWQQVLDAIERYKIVRGLTNVN